MGIKETLTDDDIDTIISREYLAKRFAKTSVLIIDEISMLSGGFLANLDRLLQSTLVSILPFGGIQVVLVGDFFQLPPVSRDTLVEFAFEHPSWKNWNLAICSLTTQYRQANTANQIPSQWVPPDHLLTILNEIRSGHVSAHSLQLLRSRNIPVVTEDHTELFTRNVSVDAYNTDRLGAIAWDIFIYEMTGKGGENLIESLKKGCLAPETLVLKKWARVMFVKNNFEAGYVNGSIGHVTGQFEWLPIVELLDGSQIIVDRTEWAIEENGKIKAAISQVPLRLAWAITVHKSQWMTLDTAVMDLSDAFVAGQGYVALSRVRSLSGLILRGFNTRALQIDPRVIEYDAVISLTSEKVEERLGTITPEEKKKRIENTIVRLGGTVEKIIPEEKKKRWPKWATHEDTCVLLVQKYSLDEIATIRGLKESTIVSHVEKLLKEGRDIDISYLRPDDDERLAQILDAFDVLQTESLSPVREYLTEQYDEEFGYDEVRLARLFLDK